MSYDAHEHARGLRMQDYVAYEAWGCLESFATRESCPQYLRDMVKEYRQRMDEARAICEAARDA